MDIDPIAVGKRIKAARIKVGLKDSAALAALIVQKSGKRGQKNLNPETVRLWEVGKILPPWDKLAQLAAVFNVGTADLLFAPPGAEQELGESAIPHSIEEQEMQEEILTRRLVKAWKALPENDRDDALEALELKALSYRSRKRDRDLSNLARPDSEIAKVEAAKKKLANKTTS